jgi:DNA repair protein RadA/Sms
LNKQKTTFFCNNCGYESAKWLGKCPACNSWNSFVEEKFTKAKGTSTAWVKSSSSQSKPEKISEVRQDATPRFSSGQVELDRVLGGGIVPGSVILVAGEPGIGKSTLMLQVALGLGLPSLYVSGEESAQQIRMRADRLSANLPENALILAETNLEAVISHAEKEKPALIILDSIQILHSQALEAAPGSVSQVRHCTAALITFAKTNNIPIFLIGHITKEGSIAGPKVLEHMVDAVLQFEGDRHLSYRMLRTIKNRFGSTSELGIYEMRSDGLREVTNPSEILITQREGDTSGVSIGATLEGNRPLLIEIQSLVSTAAYGTPQRTPTGFDNRRLNMLLAVLEKRGGFRLGMHDVFLNIAGGLRIEDPAVDLAVCTAVISSLEDISINSTCCFAAEVGLGGELRAVTRLENRITEAQKLGFKTIFCSKFGLKDTDISKFAIQVKPLGHVNDVFSELFG